MDKLKRVLYISNIEVPYRVRFFNELANKCDLTVLYERRKSKNRDDKWTKSIENNYTVNYLNGIKYKNEYSFDLEIIKYIFNKRFDVIIFGCYNSAIQIIAMKLMRIFRKKYILNLDGETFIGEKGIKNWLKKVALKGAETYLVAGEKSAHNILKVVNGSKIIPYYFSSLTKKELSNNELKAKQNKNRDEYILAVGQYFDYKGLDVILEVAKLEPTWNFKIIGTGNRTNNILEQINKLDLKNVQVISFLNKANLEKEYLNCKMLVLPSKKECWGLVINEAASYGTPIVSTYGSGAAVEFLQEKYECFLAQENDVQDLHKKMLKLLKYKEIDKYSDFLIKKSKEYNIENSVLYTYKNI